MASGMGQVPAKHQTQVDVQYISPLVAWIVTLSLGQTFRKRGNVTRAIYFVIAARFFAGGCWSELSLGVVWG